MERITKHAGLRNRRALGDQIEQKRKKGKKLYLIIYCLM